MTHKSAAERAIDALHAHEDAHFTKGSWAPQLRAHYDEYEERVEALLVDLMYLARDYYDEAAPFSVLADRAEQTFKRGIAGEDPHDDDDDGEDDTPA